MNKIIASTLLGVCVLTLAQLNARAVINVEDKVSKPNVILVITDDSSAMTGQALNVTCGLLMS